MSWLTNLVSNTPAPYRFRLESGIDNINLRHDPLEWKEGMLEMNRDLEVGGVFSLFSVSSLTFIKEGADLLTRLWEQNGMNAVCTLKIYYFKTSTRTYVEFPSSFNLNFKLFKPRVKVGNMSTGVSIEAVNTSALDKLDNRRDTDVDITKTTSIGGFPIVPYASLKKALQIPAITSVDKAEWANSTSQNYTNAVPNSIKFLYLQQTLIDSDFLTEPQDVALTELASLDRDYSLFKESTEARTLVLTGEIVLTLNSMVGSGANTQIEIRIDTINTSNAKVQRFSLATYDTTDSGQKTITISQSISLANGNSVAIYGFVETDPIGGSMDIDIDSTELVIKETNISTPATEVEAFPLYESGERLAQHILDVQYAFYSEFLGRTDVVYNLNGDMYASENQLRFFSILSGLHLRGAALSDDDSPIGLSFDDWFQSVKSWLNIGYTIETIDDFTRIRVENYDYFFDDTEVLDISDRITTLDIESEVVSEVAPLDIQTGYQNFEYLSINGRGEYNTKHKRTSILNTDVKLDNVSTIRGDTKGISDQVASPLSTTGSTDLKGDNHNFVIKTQANTSDPAIDWDVETNENITIDNDSSLFGSSSLNLYITPTRNLVRQGNRIKTALTKYLSSYIRFQTADKAQTLETTGEGYSITENEDILVDDLSDPIYLPVKHTVEVKFTWDDLTTLLTNQLGLIKFTAEISGYLVNLKKKNGEDKALITIIEKYVS